MEKINWKITAPILFLILVAYAIWLEHWRVTNQMLNGLGNKGKKRIASPPQYEIDFNQNANYATENTPTKIQLLTQSINQREKMLNYLKMAKQAKNENVKNNATQKALQAQQNAREKESYLFSNFTNLKGYKTII